MIGTPHPDERRVADLLRALEADRVQVSDRRDEILDQVLDHFERSRHDAPADPVVIGLTTSSDAPQRPSRHWFVAAAAIVIAVAGVVGLASLRGTRETTPAEPASSIPERTNPVTTGEGRLAIDVPGDLVVVANRAELIILGKDSAASSVDDAIVIVDLVDRDFFSGIDQFERQGIVGRGFTVANVDGRQFDRWTVGLTQAGIAELDCPTEGGCLELVEGVPQTSLSAGTLVTVSEIVTSDGRSILFMTDENGPLRTDLSAVLAAVTVG